MGVEEISIPTTEIEADGFITPPSALEHIEKPNTSMTGNATARPMRDCLYPKCEECDNYHGHYCTVPMVVSKQIFRQTEERLQRIEKTLAEIENLVTDEIFAFSQVKQMQIESLMFEVSQLKEKVFSK